MALKKQFNAIRYTDPQWLGENGRSWLQDIHRDAHAWPFRNPAKAWERFFANLRGGAKRRAKKCTNHGSGKRAVTVPVAGPSSHGGAAAGTVPAAVGNVTPVRYDGGRQDTSGHEANRTHFCAHS